MAMTSLMKFPSSVKRKIKEMTVNSPSFGGLRDTLSTLRWGYYVSPTSPALVDTKINKDEVRALYYNTKTNCNQGAFLARPIIDGIADYIGIPVLTVQSGDTDKLINDWVQKYWKKQLWELYRGMLRDAEVWVRLRRPFPGPLMSPDEDQAITLEVIDADRITAYHHPATGQLIRVEILSLVYIEDEPFDPREIYSKGLHSHGRQHEIIEIITPDLYMYYDATTATYLDNYETRNDWGFVPAVQVFNDFDSALHGGSSELEVVYPFFQALHDLVVQTRMAHKNYSNPKVKFKLDDVLNFLRNNFPESFVDDRFTGKVSWKDTDVFFMESVEDASFIEATMHTADSVALMEFIIDCICMAAEVTEAVMFRTFNTRGSSNTDEYERFKIKIGRKRENLESYIQEIVRMGLKIILGTPIRPKITWPYIQGQDMVNEGDALNTFVTGAEVANRAGAISLLTYRSRIREFFPAMQDDADEQAQIDKEVAKENALQLEQTKALADASAANNNGGSGPNGVARVTKRLPLEVTNPSPGN